MKISAIIPTRNRIPSLKYTLQSLLNQTRRPDEIVVVDSSDDENSIDKVKTEFAGLSIIWLRTLPSVCLQRNTGISTASGNWIFLCDDDIELKTDYIEKLEVYINTHEMCGAVAGTLLQFENGHWVSQYPVKNFKQLLWRFIFQLSIWGSIDHLRPSFFLRPLYGLIKKFYFRRKNTLSLAGWPLVTQWTEPDLQTKIYSLGANLIKKDWLVKTPYDEVLDPNGIGDNFGVALGFPGQRPIHVIRSTSAFHHRATGNRLDEALVYYRRVLALHYFLKRRDRAGFLHTLIFIWSLSGNALQFYLKGNHQMFRVTCKAIRLITGSKNPYWIGFIKNKKTVQPQF